MKFVCYTDWEDLPASADTLFASAEKSSFFFSSRWYKNLAAYALEDDGHLLLACVVDEDTVMAILPLRTRDRGNWQSLQSYYTSLYTLLLSDKNQQAILGCLVAGLRPLPFHTLRLDPVAQDDEVLNKLQQVMDSGGFESYRLSRFINWSHRLQGQSYLQYMAERPSRLRNTIARKQRKLQREHDFEIRLYTNSDLEQAMADYNTLYKASWKGGERYAAFIPALTNTMAKAGWLRFAILYIDGQPAAGQIWFVVHSKASIFRLAYDEAWQQYSPGSILTAYLMEHVIDTDKVESIDFLTGNERYKQDWMSESKERWALVIVNKQKKGTKFLNRLYGWLKRGLKSGMK